ncbi:D-aminoacyl-tRNA deacylase [Tropicimonas sp. IMCC34043]|uniref:D-aminoacyl-tRNA deacylase n=1 Tax=Tropicimonas sp. IMCC34043 TaxID=2248760 RepID=UPI000E233DF5|nr:D-aminoacyl-tRNA deacylase [Tropicimonas sp. IMCC34043]
MRALVQRVSRASVTVAGETLGAIGPGLLILVCAMRGDTEAEADRLAAKIARLRIFRDGSDKMNLSLLDTGGAALVVSQFTLAGDTSRGNRPGFSDAAAPEPGERLYQHFSRTLAGLGPHVANGQFGADMAVELVNDGPVTMWMEVAPKDPDLRTS